MGVGAITGQVCGPAKVAKLGSINLIAVGSTHACARLLDGSVVCWGDNKYGQIGDGEPDDGGMQPPTPVAW